MTFRVRPYWLEELYSHKTGALRSVVRVRERNGVLLALIGRRWCRVARGSDGKLIEVWLR